MRGERFPGKALRRKARRNNGEDILTTSSTMVIAASTDFQKFAGAGHNLAVPSLPTTMPAA